MSFLRLAAAVAAGSAFVASAAAGEANVSIMGEWRMTRAVVAPWTDEAGAGARPDWIGARVTFVSKAVKAAAPLGCENAKYEATRVPPEGLFQGAGLTIGQVNALGLGAGDRDGVSLTCDTGVFEFHFAAPDTMLLALDNRIWTLDRTPGALASAKSAEGVVQRFLEAHFDGDMGFSPATLSAKRTYLTDALLERIGAYFARPQVPDEAPSINGDPFTDSQEYPARFSVMRDDKRVKGVAAPVVFADAFRNRTVVYEMARENRRWLISDLKFEDGRKLTELLAE
jgi:hypothetical protein